MKNFSEIDWSPHSFEDPGGRIFYENKKLFRALRNKSAKGFFVLEDNKLLEILPKWNIVNTRRTSLNVEGFDVVVEHEILAPSSVVSEWTPSMLLDAALLFCKLSRELANFGLQLQDSHGWNIIFRYGNPIYVDFGSIIPMKTDDVWMPFEEFLHCFLHPLKMISHNQVDYAFYLLGTKSWVSLEETIPFLSKFQFLIYRKFNILKYYYWNNFLRKQKGVSSVSKLTFLLEKEISKLRVPQLATRWSDYSDSFCTPSISEMPSWTTKQHSIYKILTVLQKGTILDIGCNTGWYSILASNMGFDVIAMDQDRMCIDHLYQKIKKNDLKITPVSATPFTPITPHGTRFYRSIKERFTSDHTLILALIHHLFFKQGYDVDSIINTASSLTRKTLIIEYIPIEDYWIQQWNVLYRFDEYHLDNWIQSIKRYFPKTSIYNSEKSHPNSLVERKIIVAQK